MRKYKKRETQMIAFLLSFIVFLAEGSVSTLAAAISGNNVPQTEQTAEQNEAASADETDDFVGINVKEEMKEVEEPTEETNEAVSGKSGDLDWSVDADGKLTISGTGDYEYPEWCRYADRIRTAEVDVTGITSTAGMFEECINLTEIDFKKFDTAQVTDMSNMFFDCYKLTSLDVSGFVTDNVTNMSYMFWNCSGLTNLNVAGFATGSVTDMNNMFHDCSGLTSLAVGGFVTDNVTDMSWMFSGCSGLTDLDVSRFETGSVKNMKGMFWNCSGLTDLNVSRFETGNVTNVYAMFLNCSRLSSLNVSRFETGSVTNMGYMFYGCSGLTSLEVSGFTTDSVTDMSYMFDGCSGLSDLNVNGFETGNVMDMSYMFHGCSGLTSLAVGEFVTDNVTNMWHMFDGCSELTSLDISNFDTSQVTDMEAMLSGCTSLKTIKLPTGLKLEMGLPASDGEIWKDENGEIVTAATTGLDKAMLYTKQKTYNLVSGMDGNLKWSIDSGGKLVISGEGDYRDASWRSYSDQIRTAEVDVTGITSTDGMFRGCENLTAIEFKTLDTSQVTNMRDMFSDCSGLTSLDVSTFDTYQVTCMWDMFSGCSGLTSLDVSCFDTSNVTNMYDMFSGCSRLTSLDISKFDTGRVTWGMGDMFFGCIALTEVKAPANLRYEIDLPRESRWKDENGRTVTEISAGLDKVMTYKGVKVENTVQEEAGGTVSGKSDALSWSIDAKGKLLILGEGDYCLVDQDGEYYPQWYAYRNQIKTAEVSVTGITSTEYMFFGCENLTEIDLKQLNTGNVRNMDSMFSGCSRLTSLDVSAFDTSQVTNMGDMLSGCTALTEVKAPANLGDTIDLPREIRWKDENGRTVTEISAGLDKVMTYKGVKIENTVQEGADGTVSGKSDALSWSIDLNGKLLILGEGDYFLADQDDGYYPQWYAYRAKIKTAEINVKGITSTKCMFSGCKNLTEIDLKLLNTGNVTDMSDMFWGCSGLTSLDVSRLNTSNVRDMWGMFSGCSGLTSLDVSKLDTSNVTDMGYMFSGCSGLTSLDVSQFDTGNVTRMCDMFSGCSGLTSLDVGGFDTSRVASMEEMFAGCSKLISLDISHFNISQAVNRYDIFLDCTALQTLKFSAGLPHNIPLPARDGYFWKNEAGEVVTSAAAGLDKIMTYTRYGGTQTPDPGETPKPGPTTPGTESPENPGTEAKAVPAASIKITGLSDKIAAGKSVQLEAQVLPENATDKSVVWSSSDPKLASVSASGKVKLSKKAAGKTVTITAAVADGSGVKAVYKIKAMKDSVKKIKLSAKSKTVTAGKKLKVKADIQITGKSVNKKLTWKSSNTAYATVNSKGVVTTKKAGKGKTVTVTAAATDGSGKKAKIKIKIK